MTTERNEAPEDLPKHFHHQIKKKKNTNFVYNLEDTDVGTI